MMASFCSVKSLAIPAKVILRWSNSPMFPEFLSCAPDLLTKPAGGFAWRGSGNIVVSTVRSHKLLEPGSL